MSNRREVILKIGALKRYTHWFTEFLMRAR